jgi:hypothetical protein
LERTAGWTSVRIRILGLHVKTRRYPIILAYHYKGQIQVEEAGASTVWGYLSLYSFHYFEDCWAKIRMAADTPDSHDLCRYDFALSYK